MPNARVAPFVVNVKLTLDPVQCPGVTAEPLNPNDFERSLTAISRAYKRYPDGMFGKWLQNVDLVASLKIDGRPVDGLYTRRHIVVVGVSSDHDTFDTEWTFHHEVATVLFTPNERSFPMKEWRALAPSSFEYDVKASDDDLGEDADQTKIRAIWEQGFVSRYAQSTVENDLSETAAAAMMWPTMRTSQQYPKLGRKIELLEGFYKTICPDFKF